jgi:hypothetical protein
MDHINLTNSNITFFIGMDVANIKSVLKKDPILIFNRISEDARVPIIVLDMFNSQYVCNLFERAKNEKSNYLIIDADEYFGCLMSISSFFTIQEDNIRCFKLTAIDYFLRRK